MLPFGNMSKKCPIHQLLLAYRLLLDLGYFMAYRLLPINYFTHNQFPHRFSVTIRHQERHTCMNVSPITGPGFLETMMQRMTYTVEKCLFPRDHRAGAWKVRWTDAAGRPVHGCDVLCPHYRTPLEALEAIRDGLKVDAFGIEPEQE